MTYKDSNAWNRKVTNYKDFLKKDQQELKDKDISKKVNESYDAQDKVVSSYITTIRGEECDFTYLVVKTESGKEFRIDTKDDDYDDSDY